MAEEKIFLRGLLVAQVWQQRRRIKLTFGRFFGSYNCESNMNLYLLRHASAGTRRANPIIDDKRPIDKAGREHCVHLAQVLNALNLNFDLVLSSPLKRCLQTASLVGTETGYDAPIQIGARAFTGRHLCGVSAAAGAVRQAGECADGRATTRTSRTSSVRC